MVLPVRFGLNVDPNTGGLSIAQRITAIADAAGLELVGPGDADRRPGAAVPPVRRGSRAGGQASNRQPRAALLTPSQPIGRFPVPFGPPDFRRRAPAGITWADQHQHLGSDELQHILAGQRHPGV